MVKFQPCDHTPPILYSTQYFGKRDIVTRVSTLVYYSSASTTLKKLSIVLLLPHKQNGDESISNIEGLLILKFVR